ncbi:transporter substrate-binding domain-containing protein [Streptomyces sp. NPDC058308]|uniref:transporter substrate-binding domain-containing protein n=1 Tax=Streptomyces sp. NPDC058308 TaxID=3346440 RepID=UPI0036E0FCFD
MSASAPGARGGAPLRVGFQRNTPPFSYAPAAPFEPIGYSVDLARLVLAGVFGGTGSVPPLDAVEVTSSTREGLLADGRIDIECGSTTITPSRQLRCAFSRPIFRTSHRIAVKPGAETAGGALRVVGIQGSTSQAALAARSDLGFAHSFVGVPSIGAALDAFVDDPRVDAMVADEVILRALLRGRGAAAGTGLLDVRLGEEFYGFMMRKDDPEFVRAVDDALTDVFASAAFPALLTSWFTDELPGLGFGLGMEAETALLIGTGTFDE